MQNSRSDIDYYLAHASYNSSSLFNIHRILANSITVPGTVPYVPCFCGNQDAYYYKYCNNNLSSHIPLVLFSTSCISALYLRMYLKHACQLECNLVCYCTFVTTTQIQLCSTTLCINFGVTISSSLPNCRSCT